ncbi:MAG: CpaF family protein [Phycisphaerae bacterium]|nr:CpaF family protein [Phycisphaerae bacterium]MCZ2399385.1 CpaF family protein [Phycisphaerae bacterium]NUQ49464.1 CpaF family protein [Phycisphaerae bacterium]
MGLFTKKHDTQPPGGVAATAAPPAARKPSPPAPAPPGIPAKAKPPPRTEVKPVDEKTKRFNELKGAIHRKLVDQLDMTKLQTDTTGELREQVRQIVVALCEEEETLLNLTERQRLAQEILDETFGLGPLEALLKDPGVSDILINGPHQVYIEKAGRLTLTDIKFKDNGHLLHIIDKIVSPLGRRCDEVCPMVDARLKDGSRVNAIIPPLAIDGPSLSIRRFGSNPVTWDDYIRFKSCSQEIVEFLEACVHSGLNIMVAGGTGSGKTTLLNNLSSFIPDDERIVTIEDAAELKLRQPHVVRLETRPPNLEGKGRITIRDLLINSLRMRPDRIVVGECRGGETLDMLQAMNTGHEGSMTTIHANNTRDAVQRVETMVMMSGFELPQKAIRQQFASAVTLLVQAARLTGGRRKIISITEVQGMEGDVVVMQDLFRFEQDGVDSQGRAFGRIVATGVRPLFMDRLIAHGANISPSMFQPRDLVTDDE